MKVSGYTFLKNAVVNGFPFEESIRSLLPIVDEYIVAVGDSMDGTVERVERIGDSKIKIVQTAWNENMCDRGFVYGQQKMIAQFQCTGDWAFYLEGDEVIHESDLENIYEAMRTHKDDKDVEALYFEFLHFYGTPKQVGIGGYRKAPRIIRNSIRTVAPDGLFWVVLDKNKSGRYPKARDANAKIYHYGHCRSIRAMNKKLELVGRYWGTSHPEFTGYGAISRFEIREFLGSHPGVMEQWLMEEAEHVFEFDDSYRLSFRDYRNRFRFWLEDLLGCEISKKHYIRLS
mgnify:CR=1 FL=1